MTIPVKLQSVLMQYGGMVTSAQANAAGVSNERLRLLVKSGNLNRAAYGVYVLPDEFVRRAVKAAENDLLT